MLKYKLQEYSTLILRDITSLAILKEPIEIIHRALNPVIEAKDSVDLRNGQVYVIDTKLKDVLKKTLHLLSSLILILKERYVPIIQENSFLAPKSL